MDKVAMAAQYELSMPVEEIDHKIGNWFEVFYTIPFGYGWLSPLRGGVKVGIGGVSAALKKDPRKYLDEFVESSTVKAKLGNYDVTRTELHRIPMSGPLEQLTSNRIILVGDAGGFVFPGTGEGIYYALKSGRLAGEVILQAFDELVFTQQFLAEKYNEKLKVSGLLSLREVDFIETVLASAEDAERYLQKLNKLTIH